MTTLKVETSQVGWKLWFRWVGAHIISAVLIAVTAIPLVPLFAMMLYGASDSGTYEMYYILAGVAGALTLGIFGTLQWKVLQAHLSLTGNWIVASALGGAGVMLIVLTLYMISSLGQLPGLLPFLESAAPFAALFIIGTAQWFVMRQHLARSGWWILASIASGIPGNALFIWHPFPEIWIWVSIGIVYPCLTGLALVWLLRRSTIHADLKSKWWVIGGSFVVMLSVIAISWGKVVLPLYVDRTRPLAMRDAFVGALQKNQGEFAKSLAAPQQWNRIDTWIANHPPYRCQLREWHEAEIETFSERDAGTIHFVCSGVDYSVYSFGVLGMTFTWLSDGWVVENWEQICEIRNGQEICQ